MASNDGLNVSGESPTQDASLSDSILGAMHGTTSESRTPGAEQEVPEVQASQEVDENGQETAAPEETSAPKEDWLEFKATDEKGQRQVRVNLADKEGLKRILPMAYGARKFQAERDKLKGELETYKKDTGQFKENWDRLEGIYKQHGVDGVIDLLSGKKGAHKEYLDSQYTRRRSYEDAPEHEQKRIDYEEKIAALERESQRRGQEVEEWSKKMSQKDEELLQQNLQADLTPAFNANRFDGKLGNAEAEAKYNQIMWNEVMDSLSALPDDVEVTRDLVAQEFRKVQAFYLSTLRTVAKKETKQAIDSKKKEAAGNLQSAIKSQRVPNGDFQKKYEAGLATGTASGLGDSIMALFNRGK